MSRKSRPKKLTLKRTSVRELQQVTGGLLGRVQAPTTGCDTWTGDGCNTVDTCPCGGGGGGAGTAGCHAV